MDVKLSYFFCSFVPSFKPSASSQVFYRIFFGLRLLCRAHLCPKSKNCLNVDQCKLKRKGKKETLSHYTEEIISLLLPCYMYDAFRISGTETVGGITTLNLDGLRTILIGTDVLLMKITITREKRRWGLLSNRFAQKHTLHRFEP